MRSPGGWHMTSSLPFLSVDSLLLLSILSHLRLVRRPCVSFAPSFLLSHPSPHSLPMRASSTPPFPLYSLFFFSLFPSSAFPHFIAPLDPLDPYRLTDETRELGLVICRGTQVSLISPVEGTEEIANPFIQAEDEA